MCVLQLRFEFVSARLESAYLQDDRRKQRAVVSCSYVSRLSQYGLGVPICRTISVENRCLQAATRAVLRQLRRVELFHALGGVVGQEEGSWWCDLKLRLGVVPTQLASVFLQEVGNCVL